MEVKRFTSADAKVLTRNTTCGTDEYKDIVSQIQDVCRNPDGTNKVEISGVISNILTSILKEDGYSVYYTRETSITTIEWN